MNRLGARSMRGFHEERVAASGLCRASSSFRVPSGTLRRVGWRRLARSTIAVWFRDEVFRPPLAKGAISSRRAAYCGLPRGVAAAAIGRTRPSLGPRILQSSSRFAESSSLASGRGGPVRVPSGTAPEDDFLQAAGGSLSTSREIATQRVARASATPGGARNSSALESWGFLRKGRWRRPARGLG